MKLLKKPEHQPLSGWFDSKRKRMAWLALVFCFWMLWQSGWNILIGIRLSTLQDYGSLFSLLGSLRRYSSSWLLRLILQIISMGQVSGWSILRALVSSFTFWDALGLAGFAGALISPEYRKWTAGSLLLSLILAAVILFVIVSSLQADSLYAVSVLLRIFGIVLASISLVQMAILAVIMAKSVHNLI